MAIPTFTLVGTIIGSESLTAVFGMGTGGTFPIWSPKDLDCGVSHSQGRMFGNQQFVVPAIRLRVMTES